MSNGSNDQYCTDPAIVAEALALAAALNDHPELAWLTAQIAAELERGQLRGPYEWTDWLVRRLEWLRNHRERQHLGRAFHPAQDHYGRRSITKPGNQPVESTPIRAAQALQHSIRVAGGAEEPPKLIETTLLVVHRPDGSVEVLDTTTDKAYRALMRAVNAVPGSEGCVVTAMRPPMKSHHQKAIGPQWGEWRIEAYADSETETETAAHDERKAA